MDAKKFLKDPFTIFLLVWFALSVGIYLAFLYVYNAWDDTYFNFMGKEVDFTDLTYIPYSGSAIIGGIISIGVFSFYGWKSFEGKVWLMIAIGSSFWGLGGLISGFYVISYYSQDSPATVFLDYYRYPYLIGYVAFLAAFIWKAKYARIPLDRKTLVRSAVVVAIFIAFLIPSIVYIAIPTINTPGVEYSNGDIVEEDFEPYVSFTTVADNATEPVLEVTEDGTGDVSLTPTLIVSFDKAVDKRSAEENFRLVINSQNKFFLFYKTDQQEVPGNFTWIDDRTMAFTPSQPLQPETTYETDFFIGMPMEDKVINIYYVVGDLILVLMGLSMAVFWGTDVSKGWYLLSASMICMTIADVSMSVMYTMDINIDGNLLELFWVACYILIPLAGIYQKKVHEEFM